MRERGSEGAEACAGHGFIDCYSDLYHLAGVIYFVVIRRIIFASDSFRVHSGDNGWKFIENYELFDRLSLVASFIPEIDYYSLFPIPYGQVEDEGKACAGGSE